MILSLLDQSATFHKPLVPPLLTCPIFPLSPPSGKQLQVVVPPSGPDPIIAGGERGVFASSFHSLFVQKLHALVTVGQRRATERDLFKAAMWNAAEGAAVLHGNRLLVCVHEVMELAGHQKGAECERRPNPDSPWLIVLAKERPGRPVLSHWGAETWV